MADASTALAWCFADEATPRTAKLLDRVFAGEFVLVPPHWPTEVLNGVLKASRRGRVTEAEIQVFLRNLPSFEISIDRWRGLSLLNTVRELAQRHSLTAYDASYLELAIRSGFPLATRDGALLRAATIEGVAIP